MSIVHPAIPFVSSGGVAPVPPYLIMDATAWTDPTGSAQYYSAIYTGGTLELQSYEGGQTPTFHTNAAYPPDQPVVAELWDRDVVGGVETSSTSVDATTFYTYQGVGGAGGGTYYPITQNITNHLVRYQRTTGGLIDETYWVNSAVVDQTNITLPDSITFNSNNFHAPAFYSTVNNKVYLMSQGGVNGTYISSWTVGSSTYTTATQVNAAAATNMSSVVGDDSSGNIYVYWRTSTTGNLYVLNSALTVTNTISLTDKNPDGYTWDDTAIMVCNDGNYLIGKPGSGAWFDAWDISGGTLGSKVYQQAFTGNATSYARRVDDNKVFFRHNQNLWRVA